MEPRQGARHTASGYDQGRAGRRAVQSAADTAEHRLGPSTAAFLLRTNPRTIALSDQLRRPRARERLAGGCRRRVSAKRVRDHLARHRRGWNTGGVHRYGNDAGRDFQAPRNARRSALCCEA